MPESLTLVEVINIICDEEKGTNNGIKGTDAVSATIENTSQISSQIIDALMNSSLEEDIFFKEYLKTEQIIYSEIREYKEGFSKRNNGDIDYVKLETEMRRDPEWVRKFDFLGYDSDVFSILVLGEPMDGTKGAWDILPDEQKAA
ncbi:MAG: hypothetical protein PHN60_02170 [Candidatus Gracilibacteria bacterium]|nr:hypothetical protein [Candidatus Gracilibacteria bacterium]